VGCVEFFDQDFWVGFAWINCKATLSDHDGNPDCDARHSIQWLEVGQNVVGWCEQRFANVVSLMCPYRHLIAPNGQGLRSFHDHLGGLRHGVNTRLLGFVQLSVVRSVKDHSVVGKIDQSCV
jgi:hypothetical protein